MSANDTIHPAILKLAYAYARANCKGRARLFARLAVWSAPRLPGCPDPAELIEQYEQAEGRAQAQLYARVLEALNAACLAIERDREARGLPPLARHIISMKPRPN